MARRTAGPARAPDDDEQELTLNRLYQQLHTRLRFDSMLRDPPTADLPTPLRDDLARALDIPPGRERRDAIEAAGRLHLGDEVFERRFVSLITRIYDATHGTRHHRPEVVDTGPPLPARVEGHDRHSPDDEQEIEC